MEIRITGGQKLVAAGKRIEHMGKGPLRRELLRGLRTAAKPVVVDIRDSAESTLPKAGGLNARIAGSKFSVKTRTGKANLGVRITGANGYDLPKIDKGTVRHPVYGNRRAWATQSVTPGWFTKPAEASEPTVQKQLQRVVLMVARKVEG